MAHAYVYITVLPLTIDGRVHSYVEETCNMGKPQPLKKWMPAVAHNSIDK